MKKHHILYNWPISEIFRLSESEIASNFFDSLTAKRNEFTLLIEQLGALSELLAAKRNSRDFLPENDWDTLVKCIETFEREFPAFPNPAFRKFRLFCLIAKKLTAPSPNLDETEVDDDKFEFRELSPPLPITWLSRENHTHMEHSIVIFSLNSFEPAVDGVPSALHSAIEADNLSPDFIFMLLGAFVKADPNPTKQIFLIKKEIPAVPNEAGESFARLSVLATGSAVHSPRVYPHGLQIMNRDLIQPGTLYHQMNDVMNVLSEYNERRDTLAKYLTIYHVFENFMFKAPLVTLERERGGSMFSIRDFRRLYGEIDRREIDVLKKLFEVIFLMEPTPGSLPKTTFQDRIAAKWGAFCSPGDRPALDLLLAKLGSRTKSATITHALFTADFTSARFAQMVYSVRNVIVHNTETEWHLTPANFDSSCQLLLEDFLMPVLEECCFHMLSTPNPVVWYSNRELALF